VQHINNPKPIIMAKHLIICCLALSLITAACNNNGGEEKDPSTVHPPSEAIPDSMKLDKDSVIMPDTTSGNGSQVGKSDSIQKNKQ